MSCVQRIEGLVEILALNLRYQFRHEREQNVFKKKLTKQTTKKEKQMMKAFIADLLDKNVK